jgi:hypothetical protein
MVRFDRAPRSSGSGDGSRVDLPVAIADATAGDHSRRWGDRAPRDRDLPSARRQGDAAAHARARELRPRARRGAASTGRGDGRRRPAGPRVARARMRRGRRRLLERDVDPARGRDLGRRRGRAPRPCRCGARGGRPPLRLRLVRGLRDGDVAREREAVGRGALRTSGITFTILQPGLFHESWLSPATGFDAAAGIVDVYGAGETKLPWIALEDVATAAAGALDEPATEKAAIPLAADARPGA